GRLRLDGRASLRSERRHDRPRRPARRRSAGLRDVPRVDAGRAGRRRRGRRGGQVASARQFLDDEMLVTAANEAGVKVADDDVKAMQPASSSAAAGGGDERSIRRILLTRAFKQQVILKDVTVPDADVRAWFEQHLADYRQPARVVLRQILLDSAA